MALQDTTHHQTQIPQLLLLIEKEAEGSRIKAFLEREAFHVFFVSTNETAYNVIDKAQLDILITQIDGHHIDGMKLLELARQHNPEICIILLAEAQEVGKATRAMAEGVYDFQIRPFNLEKMAAVIRKGIDYQHLQAENVELTRRLDRKYGFHNILGDSASMSKVFKKIRQVAPGSETILLIGEDGTGKDLIASSIHHNSPHRSAPFIKLSCEALAENLMEAELFGEFSRNAPGLGRTGKGCLELVAGGTLFLDEVTNLSLAIQKRLLDILERGEYKIPGRAKPQPVKFRTIATSSEDLRIRVDGGLFLEKLYQRLSRVQIDLPPLRRRRTDIPLLVRHFLEEANRALNTSVQEFTRPSMDRLTQYDWPGNIRELKSMIRQLVEAKRSGKIELYALPVRVRTALPPGSDLHLRVGMSLTEIERAVMRETLVRCNWNRRQTARMLGIGLRTLYRKIKEYDIRSPIEELPGPPHVPE
ncbi:MAG: sigma-54 dependent transcriptional regulator [Candidatus Eisenbacteria bacterium]|uniref:Sigma-54 dependent transcriptional regulator n=1 Tax=Eiseniibacteriota bacterium TaxID=2212470 RepID=A0A948W5R9_UNCEI|nr:sigma-54 dependent transcriptional regulator [Candidatus Eisenbacteria bacterium]MBU2690729.1 sigma-54 dependent transcriptional regulator [Candidatus Eisenbacteria bacterium]